MFYSLPSLHRISRCNRSSDPLYSYSFLVYRSFLLMSSLVNFSFSCFESSYFSLILTSSFNHSRSLLPFALSFSFFLSYVVTFSIDLSWPSVIFAWRLASLASKMLNFEACAACFPDPFSIQVDSYKQLLFLTLLVVICCQCLAFTLRRNVVLLLVDEVSCSFLQILDCVFSHSFFWVNFLLATFRTHTVHHCFVT